MTPFTLYPAIDLRAGKVVRLRTGDPAQQTQYDDNPLNAAQRWVAAGAAWLHVVNLDGAFGEEAAANHTAIRAILAFALSNSIKVQVGGGIRTMQTAQNVINAGASRIILGTAAVENPALVDDALATFGAEAVAVGLDAREGMVQTRGWQVSGGIQALDLAKQLSAKSLKHLIYTDISRDGTGRGINLPATQAIAHESGLSVIASGGIQQLEEMTQLQNAGLAGVILGRALYEGALNLAECLAAVKVSPC